MLHAALPELRIDRMTDELPIRPCVGCGYCCRKARCAVSFIAEGWPVGVDPFDVVGESRACPFLLRHGGLYRCSIAGQYAAALAIGAGCCAPFNSDRLAMVRRLREQRIIEQTAQSRGEEDSR